MKLASILKLIDATLGALACSIAARFVSQQRCQPESLGQVLADIHRILVIRPGGMGDMILTIPVLQALKSSFPHATIDLVCESRNTSVIPPGTVSGDLFRYEAEPFRFLRALFTRRYDVVVDTEQFHHFSALFALMTRAPLRAGFRINPRRNSLYTHLVDYDLTGFEGDQFMNLLQPLGVQDRGYELEGVLHDWVSPPETVEGSRDDRVVVISAASTTVYKRWDLDRMVKLVQTLVQDRDFRVILVGGKAERREADLIVQQVGLLGDGRVINRVGDGSVADTATTLSRAGLFVGGDSGLAHLAVAVGTPTVVLFGPSDERKWGHHGPSNKVVRHALACSPCAMFGYFKSCKNYACMQSITVEDVLRSVDQVLTHTGQQTTAAPTR